MTAPLSEWDRRGKAYVAEKWARMTRDWADMEEDDD